MSSKLNIINGAYSQMRISGLTVNPTPELITLALDRLENMMAAFSIRNIAINYNFEDVPDVNSETGVEHGFNLMMETNLATNLIPDFGKEVPQKLLQQASTWLSGAAGASAMANISEVQYPSRMPLGSGNTLRNNQRHKFYRDFQINPSDSETQRMTVGDVNDYKESFHAYLSGETIGTVAITTSQGIDIMSSSNTDEIVSYRVKASDASTTGAFQTVKMVVTSNTGRVETRIIDFELGTDRLGL